VQNTRISTFIDRLSRQFLTWVENPWRRFSLIIIGLLFGNFLASAIATSTGQSSNFDVVISVLLLTVLESISWLTYGSRFSQRTPNTNILLGQRPILIAILNSLKLGLTYGMFVEAAKQ
jgi:hypothetical protein